MLRSRKHAYGPQSLLLIGDIGQRKKRGKIRFCPPCHPVLPAWTMRSGLEVEEIAGLATPVRTSVLPRLAFLQNLSSQSRLSRHGLPQRLVTSQFHAPSGF